MLVREQRIPPVRGIVAVHNAAGSPYSFIDVKRWLRLNRVVHKTDKCDLVMYGGARVDVPALIAYAASLDMRLSLRTDCAGEPDLIAGYAEKGLLDVYICPGSFDPERIELWTTACVQAGLPIRLQITPPFPTDFSREEVAGRIAEAGVAVVNVALWDPFYNNGARANGAGSQQTIDVMNDLVTALAARGVETNLIGLPFCRVTSVNRLYAANSSQYFLDHQQYVKGSYEMGLRLYGRRSTMASKAILMLLAQHTLHRNRIDSFLLPWLLQHPWYYARMVAMHKLARHMKFFRHTPAETDTSMAAYEQALAQAQRRDQQELGPVCGVCSLRRICDRVTVECKKRLPGVKPEAVEGEVILSPQHFCLDQPKYYDAIDAERLAQESELDELAREANDVLNNHVPDETITPYEYTVEEAPYDQMEGGLRWHSITNTEKLSSVLGRLDPPFTVSVGFGGGIAEYVGFSFGRHCKIVCPMEGHKHEVTLHAAEDGRYVLLRDGTPLRPSTFEEMYYVPLRLGNNLELRLTCWNIDAFVVTQFVRIWRERKVQAEAGKKVKYSVLIVTTRYARRLQAVLRSIAHQKDIDISRIEVVVAYVPGLDPTEDLLDSIQLAYPDLHVVRCPFAREHANSKGFMINEAVNMVSGDWVMLLDSDTLVSPGMFAELDRVTDGDAVFYAPDGRKMLSRETTHKILLGEIQPWLEWDELLRDAGEYRYREARSVPIGFCQVVKTDCLREIPYTELDHFEGADMWFGMEMMAKYGKEQRLSGFPVLHLDHGGSQWYGATKQF